jgi:hypothetical protein
MKGTLRLQRALSLSRALLVVLLALVYSGAPRYALAALGFEEPECSEECAGSLGDKQCPPGCAVGPCAKCPPVVAPAAQPLLVEARPVSEMLVLVPHAPAPPVAEGLFQPPRA